MIKILGMCSSLILRVKDTDYFRTILRGIQYVEVAMTDSFDNMWIQQFATRDRFSIIHNYNSNMKLNKMQRKF